MSSKNSLLGLFFDLADAKVKARSLKGTEKGDRTIKYTVFSIIQSLFMVGCVFLTMYFVSKMGANDMEGLAKSIVYLIPIILFGFSSFIFLLHSLNNIGCQRIVNGKNCRFIALIVFFVCLIASIIIIATKL